MKLSALEHLSMKITNMGDRHHKTVVIQNGSYRQFSVLRDFDGSFF